MKVSPKATDNYLDATASYTVYWLEVIADRTFFGIVSTRPTASEFPIMALSDEFTIVSPLVNPRWEVASFQEKHLICAHKLHIEEDRRSTGLSRSFIERLSDGDVQALSSWRMIKAEIDEFRA